MVLEGQLHNGSKVNGVTAKILPSLIILGSLIVPGPKYMELELTLYNVGVLVLAACFFLLRLKNWRDIKESYKSTYIMFVLVLIGMMVWGVYLLFKGEYVDWTTGKQELLMLGLGLLLTLIIYDISLKKGGILGVINGVRWVVVAFTVLALFEMATGWHLIYSRFSDPNFMPYYTRIMEEMNLDGSAAYKPTVIFYNENDLSAFLGLFTPLFFPNKNFSKWKNRAMVLELALILVIFSQNDAWICFFSTAFGTLLYLIITKASLRAWIVTVSGAVTVKMFGVQVFAGIVYLIYAVIPGISAPKGILDMFFHGGTKLTNELATQWARAEGSTGSLYTRVETYIQCIVRTFTDTKGQGFGPGSYYNFANSSGEGKILLYPHSMWIEMLTEYGVLFTILFMVILMVLYVKLFKNYKKTGIVEYALVIAIDSIFVFICFAPSSYFAVEYMWIPIGLSLAMSNIVLCGNSDNEKYAGALALK